MLRASESWRNGLFHEFPGRAHFLTAQEGWEEVAAYIVNWLDELRSQSTR